MRTAQEMFNYCLDNNFGQGTIKKASLKHFEVIENTLQKDEEVRMTFIGLHNFINLNTHENNYAYAITNKRLLFAQKRFLQGESIKSISLDFINDVSLETATGSGLIKNAVITFDTLKETFNVMVNAKQGHNIFNEVQNLIFSSKV